MPAFISEAQMAALRPVIRDGYATTQVVNDHDPIVLQRIHPDTGLPTAQSAFTPISVRLADRQEQVTGANTGSVRTVLGGEIQTFAPFVGQIGDRFTWGGRPCVVRLIEPERFGVVTVRFEMQG
jgi:hypothetical protein